MPLATPAFHDHLYIALFFQERVVASAQAIAGTWQERASSHVQLPTCDSSGSFSGSSASAKGPVGRGPSGSAAVAMGF